MWTAEMQIWNKNMIIAVVIAIYWVDALCLVNTTKKSHLVTSGQTVRIQCRANTRAIHRRTLVLFEPDEVGQWSSAPIPYHRKRRGCDYFTCYGHQ